MIEMTKQLNRGDIQSVKAAYGSAEVMRPYYDLLQRLYERDCKAISRGETFFKL